MSTRAPEGRDTEAGRLGGARAVFVASLGRKLADARDLLAALGEDPSSKPPRDELRRRLHALGAGSRLLQFEALARSLQEALAVLDGATRVGSVRETELAFLAGLLDDLPALAWGEAAPRAVAPPVSGAAEEWAGRQTFASALVVGAGALVDALVDDGGLRTRSFECERTEDVDGALQLTRAYAPDLVLVDVDLPRAAGLVEALLDDPLTEPVPIVVVGTFRSPEEGARYIALGIAKFLPKPASPETLRAVCDEVLDAREGRTIRLTLGEPTIEQLADRLADELKHALTDGIHGSARSCRVPLGEGTEVLGALWGAIARVQEIVTRRTGGAVRFGGDAPEGAIALAPWLHQEAPGTDRVGRGRSAAAEVRLQGRCVVVADDDPGVTWFISDLLRTAGCEVHEALDGRFALDLVFRVQPELVVSDILMPGLDGFGLSRALHRDVALRDTPVILLSWKEDLLQRVRELGASAAAYMRKESDSRAILARVREVIRPRARIEMRLRGDGEVRGRLDELSPRLLLELVCLIRRDARVAVRDATSLYEIEVRGGAPRKATRTGSDGDYQSGETALASLLGVRAGRFVLTTTTESVRGDLAGSLSDQLARPIAAARGALAATTGAATMLVERIGIAASTLEEFLRVTPDPARTVIARLAEGTSPRQMVLDGVVAPALIEEVLADLAARGAIRRVEGIDGADLLTPAVEAALAVLRGASLHPARIPPSSRPSAPSSAPSARPRPLEVKPAPPPSSPPTYVALKWSEPPEPLVGDDDDSAGAPSSLEDAVMRELSERSPGPGPALGQPPPIVEPSELRARSSNPPRQDDPGVQGIPSIPPDAIVPDASGSDFASHGDGFVPRALSEDGHAEQTEVASPAEPFVSPFELSPTASAAAPVPVPVPAPAPAPALVPVPAQDERPPSAAPASSEAPPAAAFGARVAKNQVESSFAPPPPKNGWGGAALAFVVLGAAVGVGLYANGRDQGAVGRASASSSPSSAPPMGSVAASPPITVTDDLPAGAEVPPGYGFLEIATPEGARVRIDGSPVMGSGSVVGSAEAPGPHAVSVEQASRAWKLSIDVHPGKTTHVHVASPP